MTAPALTLDDVCFQLDASRVVSVSRALRRENGRDNYTYFFDYIKHSGREARCVAFNQSQLGYCRRVLQAAGVDRVWFEVTQ